MTLPETVRRRVEARWGPVRDARPVGGGSIGRALRLELPGGPAFLKYADAAPAGMFPAEARGLEALRHAAGDALRVPEVRAAFDPAEEGAPGEPGWILLEWIEPGPRGPGFGERLGRGLALLHRGTGRPHRLGGGQLHRHAAAAQRRGATIGPSSGATGGWSRSSAAPATPATPPATRATGSASSPASRTSSPPETRSCPPCCTATCGAATCSPPPPASPAWWTPPPTAATARWTWPWPTCSAASRTASTPPTSEVWPLLPGYREVRRAVYQLYYLLVHVNLFGGGYVAQTRAALHEALAAL